MTEQRTYSLAQAARIVGLSRERVRILTPRYGGPPITADVIERMRSDRRHPGRPRKFSGPTWWAVLALGRMDNGQWYIPVFEQLADAEAYRGSRPYSIAPVRLPEPQSPSQ